MQDYLPPFGHVNARGRWIRRDGWFPGRLSALRIHSGADETAVGKQVRRLLMKAFSIFCICTGPEIGKRSVSYPAFRNTSHTGHSGIISIH